MRVHRPVLVVKRFGMPVTRLTVALLIVLQDLTVLFVHLTYANLPAGQTPLLMPLWTP